jgi:hypothetical protein
MSALAETGKAEDYFFGARDVIVLLPWFLESSFRAPDRDFQLDLTYSSVNAYYFIRLVDNAADERGASELALLPAVSFFHTRFTSAYLPHFGAGHPFWLFLESTSSLMAEAAVCDAAAREISLSHFTAVTARKTAGVRIPLAAVCHRYGRLDLLDPWFRFYDVLACLNQFVNDLLDWQQDLESGVETLLLSEARRRKAVGRSVAGWLVSEGFSWARELAVDWLDELQRLCPALGSRALSAWLARRRRVVLGILDSLTAGMPALATLVNLLEPPSAEQPSACREDRESPMPLEPSMPRPYPAPPRPASAPPGTSGDPHVRSASVFRGVPPRRRARRPHRAVPPGRPAN